MERDHPSAEERMVYAEVQRVRSADTGEIIDDTTARILASWWHGGQLSALQSFQSTGAIDLEALAHEMVQNNRTAETDDESESLDELARYFAETGERQPVDGWHEATQWNDKLPRHTEEQLMRVVRSIAPLAILDQDDSGELVIFTGMTNGEDGSLTPVEN